MKKLIFVFILAVTFIKLPAQTIKQLPWLHQSDMVLVDDVVRVGIKEFYKNNALVYYAEVSLNGNRDTFTIISEDFVKGEYLNNLFILKIKHSIYTIKNKIISNQVNLQSKLRLKKIIDKEIPHNQYSETELNNLFNDLVENYDLDSLNSLLASLKEPTDSIWAESKIKQLELIRQEKASSFKKDLEVNTRNFLNTVFDILAKRSSESGKVGTLFISDTVRMFWYNKCDTLNKKYHEKIFQISDVEIKFEGGQIASIAIRGFVDRLNNQIITFHNRKPIAFSTKYDVSFDYHIWKGIEIYCKDKAMDGYYILLADVLYNNYKLSNNNNNFSPIDTVISLQPFQPGHLIYRERVTDILQGRVYSDVIGYGDNNPNGLVQVEIAKIINLKSGSARRKYKDKKCDTNNKASNPGQAKSEANVNQKSTTERNNQKYKPKDQNRYNKIRTLEYFRYTIPSITITKIEENNKFLDVALNTDSSGTIRTIDMLRYSNFRAGIRHNILMAGKPEYHSTFALDVSIYSLLTGTRNTSEKVDTTIENNGTQTIFSQRIQNRSTALSFIIAPIDFNWNLYPHSNYHFNFNYRLQYLLEANENYMFPDKEKKLGQWIHQMGMTAGFKFDENANSEIFARVITNLNAVYLDRNFYQVQVGYAFKVFAKKPSFKNRSIFY